MTLKFNGRLNAYMDSRTIGLLMSQEETEEKCVQWANEDMQNLLLLCDHFDIDSGPNQFMALSLALARELVPCFQTKAKEGRPLKWDDYALGTLAVEIDRIVSSGKSIAVVK